jgi:hypothetical protein
VDFSLFDEASRDYDAEMADRRTAMVRTAVQQEIFPWLAMARSPQEYEHRRALADGSLQRIADAHDAPLSEVTAMADRLFTLFYQAKTAAGMKCGNCGHASKPHTDGDACASCGCNNFTPQTTAAKEARQVTAEGEGAGPFS